MKPLYETILDIDKTLADTETYVGRQHELPNLLKELCDCDWYIDDNTAMPTNYGYGGFYGDAKIFDLFKKYKIKKLILPTKSHIAGKNDTIKLSDFEIECQTRLIIDCGSFIATHCKISAPMGVEMRCKKLSMVNCEVEASMMKLSGLGMHDFNFRGTNMDVKRLFVYISDEKWLEHLKNLGVKKTYTIDWFPKQGEYSDVDPLEELGFKPKQWTQLEQFAIQANVKSLWGISRNDKFQFGWARKNTYFYERSSKKYVLNDYFKNWEQYILMNGTYLM